MTLHIVFRFTVELKYCNQKYRIAEKEKLMFSKSFYRFSISLASCFMVVLLAACGSQAATGSTPAPTSNTPTTAASSSGATPTKVPVTTPVTTTVPEPPTLSSCPASGTARAAVMAPLALGSHANIVYIVNQFQSQASSAGTLKRYNVSSGAKAEIVTLPNTLISDAQVSADGQWILFVAVASGQAKLQLIRMDGRGLQTLYCATPPANGADPSSAIDNLQWTTDQKTVAFESYTNRGNIVYLLKMQSGNLVTEFLAPRGSVDYRPVTWLDNTRLYLRGLNADGPSFAFYLLDTSKGANQTFSSLKLIYDASSGCSCGDFDSSYDGQQMDIVSYTTDPSAGGPGIGSIHGPSTVSTRPAAGGPSTTILTSPNMAFTTIRVVSQNTILLIVNNSGTGAGADTSHNGLWKMRADGTGLTRLTSVGGGVSAGPASLNQYNQYPWSNISRDGGLYALQQNGGNQNVSLLNGSLNGGNPTTFASIADGTQLSIVGWTTM
jgi:eukaryotic-like serine/threonine-protein kinase